MARPRQPDRRAGRGSSETPFALGCDLVVAAESAYFMLAFVNIGLVPDGGSSLFAVALTMRYALAVTRQRARFRESMRTPFGPFGEPQPA